MSDGPPCPVSISGRSPAQLRSTSEAVSRAERTAKIEGFAANGDQIVVTAGVPFGQAGTTNALRVAVVK